MGLFNWIMKGIGFESEEEEIEEEAFEDRPLTKKEMKALKKEQKKKRKLKIGVMTIVLIL